jgi:hypothetical protein
LYKCTSRIAGKEVTVGQLDRTRRAEELHSMLMDPILRLQLERKYYEITKSTRPRSELELVRTILEYEFSHQHA